MQTKRITRCAVLAAVAILLGWIERMLPAFTAVPGVKLGLGNAAVLLALYLCAEHPYADSFFIMLLKVAVTGMLFSGPSGFVYSLFGGALSWAGMAFLKRNGKCTAWGISMAGAALHVSGQMLCAMLWLRASGLIFYWATLLISALPSGLILAFISTGILKKMRKI